MNVHSFEQQFDIAEWLAATSRSAGNADSTSIDLTKYTNSEVCAAYSLGTVGASATVTIKFQESDDDSTFTDVADSGATTAALAAVTSGVLNVAKRAFTKRYARVRMVTATAACVASVFRIAQKNNPNSY
jgi:hypothetical protein